jgi:electron transfer flavoprotein beta subunit
VLVAVAVKPLARTDDAERDLALSPADEAALEWALRLAERGGLPVLAVVAGPAATDAVLRGMLAAGAAHAVRIDLPAGAPSDEVAAALAALGASRQHDIRWWCCGERSGDRASGAVPALLAVRLDWPSALGLLGVPGLLDGAGADGATGGGPLTVERRLDRGRRELLAVRDPAVLSFAAGSAVLRRAALPAMLAARHQPIEQIPAGRLGGVAGGAGVEVVQRTPFRPRAKVLAAPRSADTRQRILALTGVLDGASNAPRHVEGPPGEAAAAILQALHTWGYLADPAPPAGPLDGDEHAAGRVDPPQP